LPGFRDALRWRDPKKRFNAIHKLAKAKKVCEADPPSEGPDGEITKFKGIPHGGCGNSQPEIRKEGLTLMGTWKQPKGEEDDENRQPEKRAITPQDALDIFSRISDDQMMILGLNTQYARPEWMIISVLPVPPPPVRPGVAVDGTSMRGEDDLTYKLGDIIRANASVKRCEQEGSPGHVVKEFKDLLQYHVATYMDNNIAGQPQALQKAGRPLKTIRSRLKGKEGRLRGNLMGKRVDFSARTVITGDPNLSLDEVGVPRSTAMILTYPETVTMYNISKLHAMVQNGPNQHPGARYIVRDTGERIDLKHHKRLADITIQYGWKVERHLVDGDYIIFNRQPSLHKASMMGHRVRVMPFSTFRLNLSVTSPYNADFDGDEMNLHVPQSEETRAEVRELCMVPHNIVAAQKNGPLMGIVQDALAGIWKITHRSVFLTKEQVMNLMLCLPNWDAVIPPPAILKPRPLWTGKQVVNLAFPEGLNLFRGDQSEGFDSPSDKGLLIQNGQLMYGLLNKKIVGANQGGVIHTIYNEKGWEVAMNFFNDAQRIVNYWLLHNGFTIGIGDAVPNAEGVAATLDAIQKCKEQFDVVTQQATTGQLEPLPGMNIRETFESKAMKILSDGRSDGAKAVMLHLKPWNNATHMEASGSKGSAVNIAQISALVGQQACEGKRVPFGFNYRTLPHFTKDDYSPGARGFVENSYLRGLTPSEFFFHGMSGREGLIDTAVKTAETGYIQRRLVKAMEDVAVKYDGTVRNSLGDIVQFIYGEDGLDAKFIENQSVDYIKANDAKFSQMFKVDVMDTGSPYSIENLEQAEEIKGDVEVQQHFDEEFERLEEYRAFFRDLLFNRSDGEEETVYLPINVPRMIQSAKQMFRIKSGSRSDLHPSDVVPKVRSVIDRLVVVRGEDHISKEAQQSATLILKGQLHGLLSFKRLVGHNLNKLALDYILGDIENRFMRAQVSPGEMVGVLAAQSIGEPATQMTLNTFHFTGIASKNVTLGVPRLKEILNVAVNIKSPSMTVYQLPTSGNSQETAKLLRSVVEHTTLRSVTDMTEVYYDPIIEETVIEADQDMVESYFIIPDDNMTAPERQSKWLLRIVLSRRKLLDKGLTVTDVAAKIKEQYTSDLAIIFSDDNADEQVIRVRIVSDGGNKDDDDADDEIDSMLKRLEEHLLDSVTIRGVDGIEKAFIDFKTLPRIDAAGGIVKKNNDKECEEWILSTTGTSLKKVLEVEGVDTTRTTSNSFEEVVHVLGIEGARSQLHRELWQVLSFDGSYVNHRHLALLTDIMTARGFLMAITRFGINRADTGALMRCSFEETVEILLDAAAAGEIDDCRGISENIMLGQLAPLGTGELEVLLDREMLATAASDNAAFGLDPAVADSAAMLEAGAATPYDLGSPSYEGGLGGGVDYGASFSPMAHAGGIEAGGFSTYGGSTAYGDGGMSPYQPTSPYGNTSPFYQPTSPFHGGTSPTSPGGTSPASPAWGPTSPSFRLGASYATSPGASPAWSPASPSYMSPGVGSTSPAYNATSPSFSPASPMYSPATPGFSPTSPAANPSGVSRFSPKSPYSPTSPAYSPSSPMFKAQQQSPTSPIYQPTSPRFQSPSSPQMNVGESRYSPASPSFSPASPVYSPTSPQYKAPE
jgi:DNA-directed RNA polymerase II subunit RPB1